MRPVPPVRPSDHTVAGKDRLDKYINKRLDWNHGVKPVNKLFTIQAHWQGDSVNPAPSNKLPLSDIPDVNEYLASDDGPLVAGLREGKANCMIQINWFGQGGAKIARLLGTEPTDKCRYK